MTESVEANPYVGPRPFEAKDSDLFFGRSDEVSELLSLVTAYPVVLLYAQSGAGKTSILNAGLVPLLAEESFEVLPVARVRGFEPEDIDIREIPNIYIFNTLIRWVQDRVQPRSFLSTSISAFLKEREHLTDKQGLELPRVVIFDQFEELFTSYPDRWKEREDFFRQVAEAIEADSLLRVLFVIREDYLANLDSYTDFLPQRLRTRYRLERLRAEAACQAVERPLRGKKRSFAEGVASVLVHQLLNIRVKNAVGELIEVAGEYVEPVQLQVVCQSLWQNLPSDVTFITSEHLQEFGDVEEALRTFYEKAIETAKQETGVSENDLRHWFNDKLITPAGTRGTVFQGREQTEGIPNSAVDVLEAEHIIRAEMRAGARWYELTHDRLIEPIRKSNEFWFQRERAEEQQREVEEVRQRANEQHRRAEEQARIARLFRRLVVALLMILVVLAVVLIWPWVQKHRAISLLKNAGFDLEGSYIGTSTIELEVRQLDDFSTAFRCLKPQELSFSYSHLRNVDGLRGLTSLRSLYLDNCFWLGNIDGLQGLTSLQRLTLRECFSLENADVLRGLTSLQSLDLYRCDALKNVDVLWGLTSLQSLNLSECDKLQNLDGLQGMTSLESLDLSACDELQSVDLQGLTKLESLDLSACNALQNVDLKGLFRLRRLDLSECINLRKVYLHGLTSLEFLDLRGCTELVSENVNELISVLPDTGILFPASFRPDQ